MLASKGVGLTTAETSREPQHVCKPDQLRILHTETPAALQAVNLFYEMAMPSIELDRWLRAHGVDMALALQLAGPICELPIIRYSMSRTFQLAEHDEPGAVPAVIHVVTGTDAETPIGLVAWCRDRREEAFTYPAGLPALGIDQIDNPATYFAGKACRVHRSPLSWLVSGCAGIVPLDTEALCDLLASLPERSGGYALAAESLAHGYALQTELQEPPQVRLVVPRRGIAA
jgi:hypothetical protein